MRAICSLFVLSTAASAACVSETGFDYMGNDLPDTPVQTGVKSAADCCALCDANPDCKFWSYGPADTQPCWLKSGRDGRQPNAGRISGSRSGGPPPPPPPSKYGCVAGAANFSFCDVTKPAAQRALQLAQQLTVPELVQQMDGDMPAIPRLGVPAYHYGWEALHGPIMDCPFPDRCFTSFACSSASAASFNRSLWWAIGKAQTDEVRGCNNDGSGVFGDKWGLHLRGPQLNPVRDPRWGRSDNSPGEDAFLEGEYGAWMVLGGQGALMDGSYPFGEKRKTISEMKHFTAYNVEDGRNSAVDTWDIGLRDLAEYYFVPLKACIDKADVGAFMCSYNAINGTASCGNEWMNVDVVRKHWNWTGVIESDCGAISGIQSHGNAKDQQGAAVAAVTATVGMECDGAYKAKLAQAVSAGQVSREQLVVEVARTFKGRFQVGQFDPPPPPTTPDQPCSQHSAPPALASASSPAASAPYWESLTSDVVFSDAHQALSLDAARQSIVLLRNNAPSAEADKVLSQSAHLPLDKGLKLAVIGPNGNVSDVYTGQYHGAFCPESGTDHYDYSCLPTAFSAISKANVGGTTTFACGCKYDKHREQTGPQSCSDLVDMDDVMAKVDAADVVVLALGLDIKVTSSEGMDRAHNETGYALPGRQLDLVHAVARANKPTVVLLLSGMAVGIDYIGSRHDWPLLVPGYGGIFGPQAIAETLFGDFAPSGKLPYTIYPEAWAGATNMVDRSMTAGQGRTYRFYGYKDKALRPTFAFGDGISYTTFTHAVSASVTSSFDAAPFAFTVKVSNVGSTRASEAVLVYVAYKPEQGRSSANSTVSDTDPPLVPPSPLPIKTLVDFGRTPILAPGAAATLTFSVTTADLSMADWMGRRATFAGNYDVIFSRGTGTEVVKQISVSRTTLLDTLPAPHPNA